MAFKPTDLSGCVWWLSPQGDPAQTTFANGSGCFLDTGNTKLAKDGDQVRQVMDLSSVTDHAGVAEAYRQPIYRSGGRHGPYLAFNPPNGEFAYQENPVRARITNIASGTSNLVGQNDIYNGTGGACLPTNGTEVNYLDGIDSGWAYLRTSTITKAFSWAAGDTMTWTDNAGVTKTATYTGVAEGMAYLNGSSRAVSAAGGVSVYVAVRSKHTVTGSRATWFTHGNAGNLFFGSHLDGAGSPKLTAFINGTQRSCVGLSPSHSPQIYSLRADNTGCTFGMGDLSETVANSTAVPTGSAVPRIGQYSPDTSNQWYGAGDYFAVVVYNRKLTDNEHAKVLAYLRAVTDIQEYSGLMAVCGHSIFAGDNADTRFWELLDVERLGYELRVNAYPGDTQTQIRAAMTAAVGATALVAPYVNQSNYLPGMRFALLGALTNNFTPGSTPDHSNKPTDALADLSATVSAAQGLGLTPILTTDVDKYTGTDQWRTDVDAATPSIRAMGHTVIDWGANTRLGAAGAARNQQLFFAGYVHPNGTGQALMAAEANRVLARRIPINGASSKSRRPRIL